MIPAWSNEPLSHPQRERGARERVAPLFTRGWAGVRFLTRSFVGLRARGHFVAVAPVACLARFVLADEIDAIFFGGQVVVVGLVIHPPPNVPREPPPPPPLRPPSPPPLPLSLRPPPL